MKIIVFWCKFSEVCIPVDPIDNKSLIDQVMVLYWIGRKPLFETMETQFTDAFMHHQSSVKYVYIYIWVNIGLGNSMVLSGKKALPESLLINHQYWFIIKVILLYSAESKFTRNSHEWAKSETCVWKFHF